MELDGGKDQTTPRTWIGVLGMMLGGFMAVVDIQITNSSLRDITGGIGATLDEGSWISTSYLIGEIVTIPLTAWLSRVFSVRRYLLASVGFFLLFSCLCGIARSLDEMICFRVGQGFTGGVMIPMALTVVLSTLPKNRQPFGSRSVRNDRHSGPCDRADDRRLADRQLRLALGLLHQSFSRSIDDRRHHLRH